MNAFEEPVERRVLELERSVGEVRVVLGMPSDGQPPGDPRGLIGLTTSILDQLLVLSTQMQVVSSQMMRAADLYERHRRLLVLLLGMSALLSLSSIMVLVLSTRG